MGIENAILVGLSRQVALSRQMDIVANNIANMNTVGFRAEQVMFREFLVDTKEGDSISYVQDYGVAMDVSDGPLQSTTNPLDVAIFLNNLNILKPSTNRLTYRFTSP